MRPRLRLLGPLILALLCAGCTRSAPPPHTPAVATPGATPPGPAAVLPRAVAGVTLGMRVAEADAKVGPLTCHDSRGGLRVCASGQTLAGGVRNLELYVAHDCVISVSYDDPAATNVWETLNRLIDRYGKPALSGVRERDRRGRVHEIYGWKDAQSLYSVRFVWGESESQRPALVATTFALWDRTGYDRWETEARRQTPTPSAPAQRQPT